MDELQRKELIAAWDEWETAEDAYREEAQKHFSLAWGDERHTVMEPFTTEALARLAALRGNIAETEKRYLDLVQEFSV